MLIIEVVIYQGSPLHGNFLGPPPSVSDRLMTTISITCLKLRSVYHGTEKNILRESIRQQSNVTIKCPLLHRCSPRRFQDGSQRFRYPFNDRHPATSDRFVQLFAQCVVESRHDRLFHDPKMLGPGPGEGSVFCPDLDDLTDQHVHIRTQRRNNEIQRR